MWRIVSSYSDSLAPGLRFSKHLSDSAKASSTVQPLLIMMPVQDFEFMTSFCQTWPNLNQVYSSCFCRHSAESARRSPGMPLEERRTTERTSPLAFQVVTFRHSTHQSDPP